LVIKEKDMSTRYSRLRRTLIIVVPMLAVAAIALPRALAWGRHHHSAPTSPEQLAEKLTFGLDHLLDEIDATDAQRGRAEALVEARAPALFSLMGEGRALRAELKQVMLAEQLDRARLDAVRTKLDAVASKVADTGLDTVFQLAEVLTPAQRKQLADRIARFDK
jgi:Spy/CpxP family protein refolding chaperone